MAEVIIDLHRELLNGCRRGEHSAFHQLYSLYSKAMYNVALRIVGNTQEAEDVVQEAFISAFGSINSYQGKSTFGAWLKRIVVNKAINHLRKKHLKIVSMEELPPDIADTGEEVQHYEIESVKKAIAALPEGYRLVLTLYLLEGYDHKEISEILKITVSTSKSQYNRAKSKLRSLLKKKEVYYG